MTCLFYLCARHARLEIRLGLQTIKTNETCNWNHSNVAKKKALFSEIEKPTHFLFLCKQKEQIVLFLQKKSQKIMFHMKQQNPGHIFFLEYLKFKKCNENCNTLIQNRKSNDFFCSCANEKNKLHCSWKKLGRNVFFLPERKKSSKQICPSDKRTKFMTKKFDWLKICAFFVLTAKESTIQIISIPNRSTSSWSNWLRNNSVGR